MGACRMPFFTLAVVLFLAAAAAAAAGGAGELPMAVGGGHEHVFARLADDPTAERHRNVVTGASGASAAGAGAVEDGKAYIVGRPLFKVPPSSPCRRAKSARC